MADKEILHLKDQINYRSAMGRKHAPTLWVKTKIIGGHGLYKDKNGISQLGEVLFEEENMVPLVGVEYAMEKIFGVKAPITAITLNEQGIGSPDVIPPTQDQPYPYGHNVVLFGVGIGGTAENNITTLQEHYSHTNITDMVPFRFTNESLSEADAKKYYGKKIVDDTYAYYLKRFETDPVIHNLYKNGEDGEDGSEVESSYLDSDETTGVETFTECVLAISKKDIREWFDHNGNIEETRINTIGLYSAIYDAAGDDYSDIQLFSYLNIPSEPLSLTKELDIIYRVYGS